MNNAKTNAKTQSPITPLTAAETQQVAGGDAAVTRSPWANSWGEPCGAAAYHWMRRNMA